MADTDAQWMDEAAQAQIDPQMPSPDVPTPQPRPYEAGPRATDEELEWQRMTEKQRFAKNKEQRKWYKDNIETPLPQARPNALKLQDRQREIEQYNQLMQEYEAQQRRKGGR